MPASDRSNYVSLAVRFTMFNKGDNIVVILQKGGEPGQQQQQQEEEQQEATSNAPDL